MEISRKKLLVAFLSVLSNAFLVLIKLFVGIIIGSISVISEAIHSGVDVLAAIVAVVGVRQSDQPADEEHAFGHGKFENLSSLIQAILIFLAAAWIIYESIIKLIHPRSLEGPGIGIVVMLVSALVNGGVAWLLFKVGSASNSLALKADAWHCLTDVYTSAGVMLGLCAVQAGKLWFPRADFSWIDPIAAIIVALLIIKAAGRLTAESVSDLLDVRLPPHEEQAIKRIIDAKYPHISGHHKFRTRKSGNVRFVEFHIYVDPAMSVHSSHSLSHALAEEIKQVLPGTEVSVHIEPAPFAKR
jgi:cation diffusion facilitator family transporter